jgi:hypothetical protein
MGIGREWFTECMYELWSHYYIYLRSCGKFFPRRLPLCLGHLLELVHDALLHRELLLALRRPAVCDIRDLLIPSASHVSYFQLIHIVKRLMTPQQ